MKKYFIIILHLLVVSCNNYDDSHFIKKNTFIDFDTIKQLKMNRGVLTMRSLRFKRYEVYSWCKLIYKDSFPAWIKDNDKPDFSFEEYKFEPHITDIAIPYVLFKRKNENYFFVIKEKDTLKFKLDVSKR